MLLCLAALHTNFVAPHVAAVSGLTGMLALLLGGVALLSLHGMPSGIRRQTAFALRAGAYQGLPPVKIQHDAILRALHPPRAHDADEGPMRRNEVVAWVLHRALRALSLRALDRATPDDLATLFLLGQVMQTAPCDAGRLVQRFRRPEAVLAIRDHVDEMAQLRKDWDRDYRLFMATRWLWTMQLHDKGPENLLTAVQSLNTPDIDLWHRIVLEHDPANPDHRDAILWCLSHPGCDRATVALFFAQIALDGRLEAAARRGNHAFLDSVKGLIDAWNAGTYTTAVLALDPPDALTCAQETFGAVLDRIAADAGSARWPMPKGAFGRHNGRAVRLRPGWDFLTGRLVHEPHPEHYIADVPLPMAPEALQVA